MNRCLKNGVCHSIGIDRKISLWLLMILGLALFEGTGGGILQRAEGQVPTIEVESGSRGAQHLEAAARLPLPKRDYVERVLVAKLDPTAAKEISGLVRSRKQPGIYWFINDSGDAPRVYAVDDRGQMRTHSEGESQPGVRVAGAVNRDWEDIAVDDSGNLIVADVGNNRNQRRDLTLYVVPEPEVSASEVSPAEVQVARELVVRYPDQTAFPAAEDQFNFDCEGVFTVKDDIFLLTKHRSDDLTTLYVLPNASTNQDGELRMLERFDSQGGVTGADCSADGLRLVVTTYQSIWLFERPDVTASFFGSDIWWGPYWSKQVESVCFDGRDRILLADEQLGEVYSVDLGDLTQVQLAGQPLFPADPLPTANEMQAMLPGGWTMVVLPDTQYYFDQTRRIPPSPEVLATTFDWILDKQVERNIQLAVHVGDIVDNDTDAEWQVARTTFARLDAQLPYILATGNHDYHQNASLRETKLNDYFLADGMPALQRPGGLMLREMYEPGRLENAVYEFLAPDGRPWLFLSLEWGARDEVVEWADALLKERKYRGHTAVLVNHAYLYHDNTRLDWAKKGKTQNGNPLSYDTAKSGDNHDGEMLWQNLVRRRSQFQMVLCGHVTGTKEEHLFLGQRSEVGYRLSVGDSGHRVHEMLFNAQRQGEAGDGWIRLLEFSPDQRTVVVKTYSPYRDARGLPAWRTDPENYFVIKLTHF